jgi:hypothetical protein
MSLGVVPGIVPWEQEDLLSLIVKDGTYHKNNAQGSRLRALIASFDYDDFLSLMISVSDEQYADADEVVEHDGDSDDGGGGDETDDEQIVININVSNIVPYIGAVWLIPEWFRVQPLVYSEQSFLNPKIMQGIYLVYGSTVYGSIRYTYYCERLCV